MVSSRKFNSTLVTQTSLQILNFFMEIWKIFSLKNYIIVCESLYTGLGAPKVGFGRGIYATVNFKVSHLFPISLKENWTHRDMQIFQPYSTNIIKVIS